MKSSRMRWTGYVERIEKIKNTYMIVVGKPERTTPLWGNWGGGGMTLWALSRVCVESIDTAQVRGQ
jgi:hypothetical protein